jgi:aryl-alcohol dehydrogenase-like predicted oxidoreductase
MSQATRQATAAYCQRHPLSSGSAVLGKSGLTVSRWGFGGYRIHPSFDSHRQALRQALLSGCNLIDTSANYTDGGSETLVGEVLSELFESGKLRRDEVVVISKAGYIQGANLKLAQERESEGRPFAEIVRISEGLWHCLSPEFLEDQITRSLERLRLQTLDGLLLHNPEYFLKSGGSHQEYYARIQKAFAHLETEIARGRIARYGVSSNSFPDPRESPEYTSLETLLELAHGISPANRFELIQFPFNLFEPGAVLETNNTGKTVAELAAARKLGTLINRPLNAFSRQQMIRLAEPQGVPESGLDPREAFEQALKQGMALEAEMPPSLRTNEQLRPLLQWAHAIARNLDQIPDLVTWNGLLREQIQPRLSLARQQVKSLSSQGQEHEATAWMTRYDPALERIFSAAYALLSRQDRVFIKRLRNILTTTARVLDQSPTISQQVLQIYAAFPGIHCILIGMRRPEYVDDVLSTGPVLTSELALDALESAQEVIENA